MGIRRVGNYLLLETIGYGSFGKVKHAVHEETTEQYAVKVMEKKKIRNKQLSEQIRREISIMAHLKHPNVVRLHQVLASAEKIYIVMELITGGELFDEILRRKRLPEDEARNYFQQLIRGVQHCHARGVYHRDLKPENLLLDADGLLKITDFGLSALKGVDSAQEVLYTQCGTPHYVAPEIIRAAGEGYSGAKIDIWSCGIILFVLLAGYLPFDDDAPDVLFQKILSAQITYPEWFSGEVVDLLKRMLCVNPIQRISIPEIKKHPWYTKSQVAALTEEERRKSGMLKGLPNGTNEQSLNWSYRGRHTLRDRDDSLAGSMATLVSERTANDYELEYTNGERYNYPNSSHGSSSVGGRDDTSIRDVPDTQSAADITKIERDGIERDVDVRVDISHAYVESNTNNAVYSDSSVTQARTSRTSRTSTTPSVGLSSHAITGTPSSDRSNINRPPSMVSTTAKSIAASLGFVGEDGSGSTVQRRANSNSSTGAIDGNSKLGSRSSTDRNPTIASDLLEEGAATGDFERSHSENQSTSPGLLRELDKVDASPSKVSIRRVYTDSSFNQETAEKKASKREEQNNGVVAQNLAEDGDDFIAQIEDLEIHAVDETTHSIANIDRKDGVLVGDDDDDHDDDDNVSSEDEDWQILQNERKQSFLNEALRLRSVSDSGHLLSSRGPGAVAQARDSRLQTVTIGVVGKSSLSSKANINANTNTSRREPGIVTFGRAASTGRKDFNAGTSSGQRAIGAQSHGAHQFAKDVLLDPAGPGYSSGGMSLKNQKKSKSSIPNISAHEDYDARHPEVGKTSKDMFRGKKNDLGARGETTNTAGDERADHLIRLGKSKSSNNLFRSKDPAISAGRGTEKVQKARRDISILGNPKKPWRFIQNLSNNNVPEADHLEAVPASSEAVTEIDPRSFLLMVSPGLNDELEEPFTENEVNLETTLFTASSAQLPAADVMDNANDMYIPAQARASGSPTGSPSGPTTYGRKIGPQPSIRHQGNSALTSRPVVLGASPNQPTAVPSLVIRSADSAYPDPPHTKAGVDSKNLALGISHFDSGNQSSFPGDSKNSSGGSTSSVQRSILDKDIAGRAQRGSSPSMPASRIVVEHGHSSSLDSVQNTISLAHAGAGIPSSGSVLIGANAVLQQKNGPGLGVGPKHVNFEEDYEKDPVRDALEDSSFFSEYLQLGGPGALSAMGFAAAEQKKTKRNKKDSPVETRTSSVSAVDSRRRSGALRRLSTTTSPGPDKRGMHDASSVSGAGSSSSSTTSTSTSVVSTVGLLSATTTLMGSNRDSTTSSIASTMATTFPNASGAGSAGASSLQPSGHIRVHSFSGVGSSSLSPPSGASGAAAGTQASSPPGGGNGNIPSRNAGRSAAVAAPTSIYTSFNRPNGDHALTDTKDRAGGDSGASGLVIDPAALENALNAAAFDIREDKKKEVRGQFSNLLRMVNPLHIRRYTEFKTTFSLERSIVILGFIFTELRGKHTVHRLTPNSYKIKVVIQQPNRDPISARVELYPLHDGLNIVSFRSSRSDRTAMEQKDFLQFYGEVYRTFCRIAESGLVKPSSSVADDSSSSGRGNTWMDWQLGN
eukprot:CAMPEP_0184707390 /NCGR_PEP_ID=MMETSP0313-20130426/37244_1 /TAXON_ID=2792 /ORGANISM="Porphyridium aerugineum, Strain SAG 1380-2" /LENGTH=1578 /DNA_ID=CAMNT_0027168965 /DNA_START=402 /DNA_END=5138 /DNA_ORIENTATION=+